MFFLLWGISPTSSPIILALADSSTSASLLFPSCARETPTLGFDTGCSPSQSGLLYDHCHTDSYLHQCHILNEVYWKPLYLKLQPTLPLNLALPISIILLLLFYFIFAISYHEIYRRKLNHTIWFIY